MVISRKGDLIPIDNMFYPTKLSIIFKNANGYLFEGAINEDLWNR